MPRDVHSIPFVIHPSDELGKNIDLKNLSRNLATKYADGHVVTDDDLQIVGRNLWNGLSADAQGAFEAARKEAGEKILPVVIHSDAADVQALPWETLFHPTYGFIGKNPDFTLTRRSSAQEATGGLDQGPLRVLLFTSLPANFDPERNRLNVEEEQVEVQAALLPWIAQGLVTLEMPDDGRFSMLQNLLKEFQPHVLFLSGHGNFHHMPHANEAYGEFFFEDEAGDSVGVKEDEIADALRGTGVQAVILSACESGKAASDELSNGLTRKISSAGITHVVGMREAIYDVAGIQFARALCDSLARQERMDVALQAARIAIQLPFKDVARASSPIGDELSYGQWCLPLLISSAPSRALIDWHFTPREVEARAVSQKINTVIMPTRFIGRRAEMHKYKNSLLAGKIHSLLITGPGGQGKTSLAGKLALDLQAHGYRLFAWSARPENLWRDFELEMEQTLDRPRVDRYDKFLPRAENESARAQFMLDLLLEQFNGRVVLFLDNLETFQDLDTLAMKDSTVEAWLRAANQAQGVILLVTSRWQIPDWNGEHEPLTHVNYGDFLQIAQKLSLPPAFLTRRNSLRQVFDIIGGNVRGLEFFASAVRDMENADEESAFLEKLSTVKEDLQANMAIEVIYNRLSQDAKKLLARLPAYHEPVPIEGLHKLGKRLPNTGTLLNQLIAISLLEVSYNSRWNVTEYQCTPMVVDWMEKRGLIQANKPYSLMISLIARLVLWGMRWFKPVPTFENLGIYPWLNAAANYQLDLLEQERDTLPQAINAYHALRRAGRHAKAERLALDYIVNPMTRAGFYATLLNEWLSPICKSKDLSTRAEALGQSGKVFHHLGDYKNALLYMEQALAIRKKIHDKAGVGRMLNHISQVFKAQGDYEAARKYLEQSLAIRQQISDKAGEGITLNNIAGIYWAQSDYKAALSYMEHSLVISQQIGDQAGEGRVLNNISQIHQEQGNYEEALPYLKKALAIIQQLGDKLSEGAMLSNISGIYWAHANYDMALFYLKQSLVITQQIGDKAGEGKTLNNISGVYWAQGDYDTALSYMEHSLVVSQQIGDKATECGTLNNISQIYMAQGSYQVALSYMKKSLDISRQIGNRKNEGVTLNNISQVHQQQGEYKSALYYLKESLAIVQEIGDKANESTTLNNISGVYWAKGDYDTALSYMKQSLAISQHIGDKASEGVTLNNISAIYFTKRDLEIAFSYAKQSLAIAQEIGNKESEGTTLNTIAQIYEAQNDYEMAFSCLKQSLAIREQIGDKAGEGATLNNIARIFWANDDYDAALSYMKKSLAIRKQIGDKAGLCVTLFNIGHIHAHNNQMRKAMSAWVSSYIFARQIGDTKTLQSLSELAPNLDMPEGIEGWNQLAQRIQNREKIELDGGEG